MAVKEVDGQDLVTDERDRAGGPGKEMVADSLVGGKKLEPRRQAARQARERVLGFTRRAGTLWERERAEEGEPGPRHRGHGWGRAGD